MAAKLKCDETGTQGARRIVAAQIADAIEALEGRSVTDRSVHMARKHLKKARATLRLLRESLGSSRYHHENSVLRDAARPLSELRDGQALIDTLSSIVEHCGSSAAGVPLTRMRRVLTHRRNESRQRVLRALKPARAALHQLHRRCAKWQVGKHGWSVLGSGLARTHSRSRQAFKRAWKRRTTQNLHEWRKQAKYLRYQLEILQPIWPGVMGELSEQAHELADLLGDDHDLAVLRGKVEEEQGALADPASHAALLASIDHRRGELQVKALKLGQRLYAEKSRPFVARLGRYWKDWCEEPA
jgi:CHAD domain-containing protein